MSFFFFGDGPQVWQRLITDLNAENKKTTECLALRGTSLPQCRRLRGKHRSVANRMGELEEETECCVMLSCGKDWAVTLLNS